VDDERRMRAVLRGIDALPVSEREVITLIAWEGMDYQAAATALGVPVGTIRSRLSRARSRLSRAGRPDLAQEQRWTH
jgi:RNA polymerase sigma-70 factor (ECF subfamily)